PSRIAGAAIGVAALGTLAVVFMLPADAWQHALAVLAVLAWVTLAFWVVALRRGRFAITQLRLAPDLVVGVHRGDGRLVPGHRRRYSGTSACRDARPARPAPGCVWPRRGERMGPGPTALMRKCGRFSHSSANSRASAATPALLTA